MTHLEKALSYAKAGIAVIPCEPANKEPIWALVPKDIGPDRKPIPRTGGVKKATRDPAKIAEWWGMRPDAMIGGATGEASGFWAIDPDVPKPKKNGRAGELSPDGAAAWEKLKAEYGGHAQTVEVTTPSGGRHIYFRCDPARPSGNREGNLSGLGINVRGNGGYVILPPSRRWPDGKAYEAPRPINPGAIADAPAWLYDLIRPARKQPTPGAFPHTPENERNLRDALSTIPADAREMWLKIGGALHALGPEWSGTARHLWDEWSQSEPGSFDLEDQDATWQGFDPAHPNGATVGTIFFEAKERGWRKTSNGDRNEGYLPPGEQETIPVKILTYDEMLALPEAGFAVDGVIVYRGKNVIFGASNTFKSFHAVDLGCSISTGRSYHGKVVKKMKTFYAANEGAIGIGRKRIAAWMAYHQIPQAERRNIFLIRDETIIPDAVSRDNLIAGIRKLVEPGEDFFIVFDIHRGTMNAPDKDDDAADAWIKGAESLIKEGATTLSIAHSPYSDDARARGSSHQWGSWDGRIQSEGDKEKRTSVLKVDRFKDHESCGQFGFTLDEQEVEEHPGEFSLVPRLDGTVKAKKPGPPPKQKSLLVEVIEQALTEAWVSIMPFTDGPAIKAVADHAVRDRYYLRLGVVEPTEPRAKATLRTSFNRPLKDMIDRREVLAHPINGERHLWLP